MFEMSPCHQMQLGETLGVEYAALPAAFPPTKVQSLINPCRHPTVTASVRLETSSLDRIELI